jgi:hypothetical protein
MKHLNSFFFALALTIVGAGSVWGQTGGKFDAPDYPVVPEIPEEFLGMTYADILQSGDTYSATLDFATAQTWENMGGVKVFLYRFTVSELDKLILSGSFAESGEFSILGQAMLFRKGEYYWETYNYLQFTSYDSSTGLLPGAYFLMLSDDYFLSYSGHHAQVNLNIRKATLPVAPLDFSHDYPLSVTENQTTCYSFTLNAPQTVNMTVSNASFADEYHYYGVQFMIYDAQWNHIYNCNAEEKTNTIGFLFAGTYHIICNAAYSGSFHLQLTSQAPATITLPYDQNITLQPYETREMRFILDEEQFVTFWGSSYAGLNVYNGEGKQVQHLYLGNYTQAATLAAGTYYAVLQSYIETTINLRINAIDVSNVSSYTAIDYSTPLQKGVLTSGTLTASSLGYVSMMGEYYNEETDEYEMTLQRQYGLMKGFSLAVEAGRQYIFSNIANDMGFAVLKNGELSGNLINDLRAVNMGDGSNQTVVYTATETGTVRILVVLLYNFENGAYTFKVAEGDTGGTIITIPELCAQAATLTYTAELSETLQIDFNAQTPRVQMEFADEYEWELSGLQWISPAKAYKINIPAVNQGIYINPIGDNLVCLFRKEGNTYQPFVQEEEFDAEEIPAEYAGEWYIVFVNQPFTPVSSFTADIWVTTPPVNGDNVTIIEMLDNAPTVALPYSVSGNTAMDGAVVSQTELENYGIYVYNPSKVVAKKVTFASPANRLYVRSNLDYVALLRIDNTDPARRYEIIHDGWGGNLEYSGWYYDEITGNYEESVPAGDYWVIGMFDYDGNQDYWLQISTSESGMTVTSITANAASIGVNENATEVEIKALLSLLQLTAHFDSGITVPMRNLAMYWNVAADGEAATLDCTLAALDNFYWLNSSSGGQPLNIPPLTIQIKYTGNDVPDVTGLNDVESTNLFIYSMDKQLYVEGIETGTAYQLFDINGKRLSSGIAADTRLELTVYNRGVYIFRAGTKAIKVLVR